MTTTTAAGAPGDTSVLDSLVSPFGVVSHVGEPAAEWAPEELCTKVATVGSCAPGHEGRDPVVCGGRAWRSAAHARRVAIAEAAERYSAGDFLDEERVWATADELPGPVLDPDRYPRCSSREYADPRCPVTRFDRHARIRWVRGLDLGTAERTWLPACMATYFLRDPTPAERFAPGISTGYAAHTDPVRAVLNGLLEVVERDGNALVWLQRLPLPPIDRRLLTEETRALIEWARIRFVRTYLFDATTDARIPTAYCLLVAQHDDAGRCMIGSSAGRTLTEAAEGAAFETVPSRAMFNDGAAGPTDVGDFTLMDGARYMGAAERAHAFAFLIDGLADRAVSGSRDNDLPPEPAAALAAAVDRLAALDMPVIVVDRTTDELADAGLTAVNVVVPDLQPMSLRPLAQFRGHRRLFTAPAAMGYRVLDEKELNPWPQPFA